MGGKIKNPFERQHIWNWANHKNPFPQGSHKYSHEKTHEWKQLEYIIIWIPKDGQD